MKKRLGFWPLIIFIIFLFIPSVPEPAYSDCAYTYCTGTWFQPCRMYDWNCQDCSWQGCRLTCLYYAVLIICHDEYGEEYWLSRCHNVFCGLDPD